MNKQESIFTKKYAEYYDWIYSKNKDYKKECDFIEVLFKQFAKKKPDTILDMACGTGNHALILAKRKYKLRGIDFSSDMIKIASKKAKQNNLDIPLETQKMQDFKLNQKFDAIICMFAAFDYVIEYKDILSMLKQVREHMHKDSLFLFDFWNGNEVLRNYSPVRVKSLEKGNKRLIRISQTNLNKMKNVAEIDIEIFVISKNKIIEEHFKEKHHMRYFFFNEIKNYLENSGLKLLKFVPLLNPTGDVQKSWNITAIAKLK